MFIQRVYSELILGGWQFIVPVACFQSEKKGNYCVCQFPQGQTLLHLTTASLCVCCTSAICICMKQLGMNDLLTIHHQSRLIIITKGHLEREVISFWQSLTHLWIKNILWCVEMSLDVSQRVNCGHLLKSWLLLHAAFLNSPNWIRF